MRHTPRRRIRIQDLIDELLIAVAQRLGTDSDAIEPAVLAVVAYLVEEYPAQDFYIPAPTQYSENAIRADLDAGRPLAKICRTHGVGMSTVYRIKRERKS